MADFKHRENTGSLFRNSFKKPDNNQPDYRGTADIDGEEYEVAAWIKAGKAGKFMSLSFKPKGEKPKSARKVEQEQMDEFGDSTIPF